MNMVFPIGAELDHHVRCLSQAALRESDNQMSRADELQVWPPCGWNFQLFREGNARVAGNGNRTLYWGVNNHVIIQYNPVIIG